MNKQLALVLGQICGEAMDNVYMIGICLQQLVFTTHNILEMSKIKEGKFVPNIKKINFKKQLNYFVEYFKQDMEHRQIRFTNTLDETLQSRYIMIDEARLSLVLYNLISNSVKYTQDGEVSVSAKVITLEEKEELSKLNNLKNQSSRSNLNQSSSFDHEYDKSFSEVDDVASNHSK